MKKALIFNEQVIQIEDEEFPVAPPLEWIECLEDVQVGWSYEGTTFRPPPAPPAPTLTEQFEAVRVGLQGAIDTQARAFGFSGGNALILYAGFTNAFQSLAQLFATWEVSVWVQAGAYRDQVLAGTQPMLTPAQAIAMMPAFPS